MQTKPAISTNKIIIFVVFIAAAIMTSLFVFHMSQKPKQSMLAEGEGTLFPVARDIKAFELSAGNKAFTQKDFLNHWTLLFFGFTHCNSVCPTTLEMLNRVYIKLQDTYPNLQVVLISLDPDRDSPEKLTQYTHSFNPKFIGVTGKIQNLRKLQSQLGIYSARENESENNYQLQHTASILLINPQGKWAGLFRYGMNPDQFASAFEKSMQYFG